MDCKRCGRGKQNQLRVNAYQKALCGKRVINVPSVYGLLQSVMVGDEWKRIPYRSEVQSELWLFAFVCVFCFLNMDLCLLADRAKWSNCWKGFCWWPGCGLAQTGNVRYNRNVLCAEVTQEFAFFQNCNMWVCHLILTRVFCSRVEERTAIISGHGKRTENAFKEKWIGKTVSLLTVLASESWVEFIWVWGFNVLLLFWMVPGFGFGVGSHSGLLKVWCFAADMSCVLALSEFV